MSNKVKLVDLEEIDGAVENGWEGSFFPNIDAIYTQIVIAKTTDGDSVEAEVSLAYNSDNEVDSHRVIINHPDPYIADEGMGEEVDEYVEHLKETTEVKDVL